MSQTEIALHEILRQARRKKKWTQSELAEQAGCTQSAICMMELGHPDALARDKICLIAEKLGVNLEAVARREPLIAAKVGMVLKYCPDCRCPSNIPYAVGDE